MQTELFACPDFKHALSVSSQSGQNGPDELICSSCDKKWPIRDGIPVFLKDSKSYWGEVNQSVMEGYISRAKQDGILSALHDSLSQANSYLYNYAANPTRADFKYILPIDETSTVLDFGCGWGMISIGFSALVKRVIAFDMTFARVRFLAERVRQAGNKNVIPICGGDFDFLPLPHASVDVAILNGVLEWIGKTVKRTSPRAAQLDALKNIHQTLKPNGALYVGIENRFGYNYFLGDLDHNGLKFTNLMPRVLADVVSWIRKRETYRTYTYSYLGYRRLLKKAGFSKVKIYWTYPNYREILAIIPLESHTEAEFYLKRYGARGTLRQKVLYYVSLALCKLRLLKYVVPAYGIVATQ